MTIEYQNGIFEGKQQTFYPDGTLKSEAEYKPIMEDVRRAYVIVKEKVEARPVIREIIEQ